MSVKKNNVRVYFCNDSYLPSFLGVHDLIKLMVLYSSATLACWNDLLNSSSDEGHQNTWTQEVIIM